MKGQTRILGSPKDYLLKDIDNAQMALSKIARSADMLGFENTRKDIDMLWLDLLRVQSALVTARGRPGLVTLAARVAAQEERAAS
jgi:hypothetical protein